MRECCIHQRHSHSHVQHYYDCKDMSLAARVSDLQRLASTEQQPKPFTKSGSPERTRRHPACQISPQDTHCSIHPLFLLHA